MFFYFLLEVLGRICSEMRLGLRFRPKVVWTFLHILGKKLSWGSWFGRYEFKKTSSFEQRCVQKNFVLKNGFQILF